MGFLSAHGSFFTGNSSTMTLNIATGQRKLAPTGKKRSDRLCGLLRSLSLWRENDGGGWPSVP